MSQHSDILVVQTAFLGDAVLTLPLIQRLGREFPAASVDVVVVPSAAGLFVNHPDVRSTIVFDKRGSDSGPRGLLRLARRLRSTGYDLAVVPHRSLRSALLVRLAGIPVRIGFHNSAGWFFWSSRVRYEKGIHEILRNLRLLGPLGVRAETPDRPRLYPPASDKTLVDELLRGLKQPDGGMLVAIAPGTVWNTKRWPEERYAGVARELVRSGHRVVLIGGPADAGLCARIADAAGNTGILDASGKLTLLGSAEMIARAGVLVCNDSAPLHLATAMGVKVVSIFGATVPGFGFGPVGDSDIVVETEGLSCRPCTIHGGDRCPIGTFECMGRIGPERVLEAVTGGTGGHS